MLSIGILFSETALAPESAMLERIWPFFVALVILGIITVLLVVLRGDKKGDDRRPKD
jgi:ABC-type transport system involved in multi-copper enzyme maturation permease subunit